MAMEKIEEIYRNRAMWLEGEQSGAGFMLQRRRTVTLMAQRLISQWSKTAPSITAAQ